jgi:Rps23 Pro-64 3,4-dihydroxylase Tpa1-like proline 4-hydroxylase
MYQIFDNFLPKRHLNELQEMFSSNDFPWFYSSHTTSGDSYGTLKTNNVTEGSQFTHLFYYEDQKKVSAAFDIIYPSVVLLENTIQADLILVRIKANLLLGNPAYPDGNFHTPHIDYVSSEVNVNHKTFLFYVFDSDGDTVLFNEIESDKPMHLTECARVKPKANRGILFNSNQYHASCQPKLSEKRVVINYVFKEK